MRFDEDLSRWERGEMPLDELAARHPGQDVFGLAGLYLRLSAAGWEPAPDPGDGWESLAAALPDQVPAGSARGRRWSARAVAMAAALTFLTTGLALAIEPIRRGVTGFFREAAAVVAEAGFVEPVSRFLAPLRAAPLRADGFEDRQVAWLPSVSGGDSPGCVLLELPANGRADVHADCSGGWYQPSPDFHGQDSFTYAAVEEGRISAPASVRIVLQSINDTPTAEDDESTTDEDAPVTVRVLGNDADVDLAGGPDGTPGEAGPTGGGALTVASVSGAEGSVEFVGDRLVYRPPLDFHGIDDFRYTIEDGLGASDTASVRVTVRPVNDDPVVGEVSATGEEDSPVPWLAAVSDVDGDPLTCSILVPPEHGETTVRDDCTGGTYTGERDFNGSDVLSFSVTDGTESITVTATVSVEAVNDPPEADDVSESGDEDSTIEWMPATSDVEEDPLTCSILDPPANGTAAVRPDCSGGTYQPGANQHGADAFTYAVTDGTDKAIRPASVKVTVRPVNDPPAAGPDAATTIQGVPVTIAVLSNDADVDVDELSVTSVGPAGAGSAILNPDGTITYVPGASFIGTDSFFYTVSDLEGASAVGTVTVLVSPPPPPIEVPPPPSGATAPRSASWTSLYESSGVTP